MRPPEVTFRPPMIGWVTCRSYATHQFGGTNMLTPQDNIDGALRLIRRYGGIDGNHHKQWVLDHVVRLLLGLDNDAYAAWVKETCAGEDGPDTYSWDRGTPP